MTEGHYVYILECDDDTFYTGYTTDLDRRLKEHNNGNGAKYTRGRTPVELIYSEAYASRSDAMRREAQIKDLSREEKERLIDPDEKPDGWRTI